ncbi:MAG: succinate dehydrogenase cytochrome b subunit [Ignavibacteria bacterium]|nr:succinate dehydrogenase cytochrome b subunit [Ignavibacteria bacterium]
MRRLIEVWRSTVFQKWVMAITGVMLGGFLLAHLAGNLLIFVGADDMNAYAVELRELLHGSAIWVMRAVLVISLVLHVRAGIVLAQRNRTASGGRYAVTSYQRSTLASRSMLLTGLLILSYVLYHLAHFTFGAIHTEYYHYIDSMGRHDVYRMVVESFRQPVITILYVVAVIVTGFHLQHAIASAFQTLGINHPRYSPSIKMGGTLLSILIVIGFISVPMAIIFGLVQ